MEKPQEVGAEPPDSQSHTTDWRFAVCSFSDAWEEEPAPQVQVKDASPPKLLGSPLSRKLQLPPQMRAADGSGDGQRSTLGGSSVQPEKPAPSGANSLLGLMTSHLSPGGGLIGDPNPGGALPAGLGPGGLDNNLVGIGNPLSETSPKLLEAGTRDAEGRAVLLLCAHNPAWLHPKCSSHELICLLLYLRGITRCEIQALGLTILVDARICSPTSSLLWGLSQLQEAAPGSVHQVLLVGKIPDEVPSGLQFEHLPTHQSLLTHIPTAGLPTSLGGCLPYCHQAWLQFRMRLEALLQNCQVVCTLLQAAIKSVKVVPQPMESGEVGQLLQQVQVLMQQVLDSPQLEWLQHQGGLELMWLKQELPEVTLSPDYRPAVDKADVLYGRVDGLLHQLTLQSNQRVRALESLQALEAQEGRLNQIEVWLQQVGWPALEERGEPSLDMLLQAQGPFRELDQVAQASTWAEAGQRVLAELEQEHPRVVLQQLQLHWTRHPDLPPAHFRKIRWAWAQCQDTWLALDQKLEAALKLALTGNTATLCITRVPAAPATPPLRKSYSFDQNLGQSLSEPVNHYHHATTVTACHGPDAGGCPQPRLFPTTMPLPDTSDFRSPTRLQLVLAEMVATEQEYVRALEYTMENYFPELDRPDVPQGLRGQRAHLFGNLEKLRDFHCHFFLRELEACTRHPPRVAYAFLRHRVQFGMYALYSKNKPRSDALMTSYGHAFFKDKQKALGDHLDLASYLLKPIQRMSKYALLLQELARACGGPVQELNALQAAQSLVHFQLRHGNDLLAMDAIQGCDVNLKEQGQLVRQDEFMVRAGRHKSLRRVFLFEELLLFSKPRRGSSGLDTFTYKRSFKMADLGLTESCGDNKLRFEIWFRRRKARDTFMLQASSLDTKQAWTTDISCLLWRQAVHNKEVRMAEMVSMGVGNKAFRDIAPSEEAIKDRNINCVLKSRDIRSRASIAVAPLNYESPYLGASDPALGDPACCSVLGSLNLHLHRDPALLGFRWPLYPSNFSEEATLEAEVELGSQPSLSMSGLSKKQETPLGLGLSF
ncbi:Puratrophin-1 [Heterocephalus glaber]|uniref:Puratrophin-1 n=1 Tax=Heterocephalus glaber TaxID=10181 RepID=G5C656_HETGA|nr:Puratrophin-1 [Heterocephalus glaber]